MAYEIRANTGSLFRNVDKIPDRKDPDLTGKIMLPDGTLHWFKAWSKQTSAGERWLSCMIGDRCQVQPGGMSQHSVDKGNGYQPQPDDSDIPF